MNSEHPIARGIVSSLDGNLPKVEHFDSIPGKGTRGIVEGKEVFVVSPGYLREKNIKFESPKLKRLFSQGKTVVFVLVDGKLAGAIALSDMIREESKEAVKRLKEKRHTLFNAYRGQLSGSQVGCRRAGS
nr:HAD family hydrolase [Thermosulfidibacter takaii]